MVRPFCFPAELILAFTPCDAKPYMTLRGKAAVNVHRFFRLSVATPAYQVAEKT